MKWAFFTSNGFLLICDTVSAIKDNRIEISSSWTIVDINSFPLFRKKRNAQLFGNIFFSLFPSFLLSLFFSSFFFFTMNLYVDMYIFFSSFFEQVVLGNTRISLGTGLRKRAEKKIILQNDSNLNSFFYSSFLRYVIL